MNFEIDTGPGIYIRLSWYGMPRVQTCRPEPGRRLKMRLAIGNRTGRAAWLKAIAVSMIVVFAGALHAADKSAAPAPVIDNDRVVVWNLHLNKGEAGPYTPKDLDTVVVFLKGGSIRSESSDGHVHLEKRRAGDAVWVPKGSPLRDTPTSEEPVDEVVISLKDT